MVSLESIADFARKLLLMALLGFLVLMLAGPVLAVLSILIPFAVIGFLAWLPYRLAVLRKPIEWRAVGEASRNLGGIVFGIPVWIAIHVWRGAGRTLHLAGMAIGRTAGFARRIFVETVSGGVVGGLLGAIGATYNHDPGVRIPLGVVVGAGVGMLVALFWREPAEEARPAPDSVVLPHPRRFPTWLQAASL